MILGMAFAPLLYMYAVSLFDFGPEGILLQSTVLSTIYGFTSGTFVSSMIAEEKEKNTLKTLLLNGVSSWQYLFTVIFFPLLFSIVEISLLPLIMGEQLEKPIVFFAITSMTSLVFVEINVLIALLSKGVAQSSFFSMLLYMLANFLPLVTMMQESVKKWVDWTFVGPNTNYFLFKEITSMRDQNFLVLGLWIFILGILLILVYRKSMQIGE